MNANPSAFRFTPEQQRHEADIEVAYRQLLNATTRRARVQVSDLMAQLIHARDPEVLNALEVERLERAGVR